MQHRDRNDPVLFVYLVLFLLCIAAQSRDSTQIDCGNRYLDYRRRDRDCNRYKAIAVEVFDVFYGFSLTTVLFYNRTEFGKQQVEH